MTSELDQALSETIAMQDAARGKAIICRINGTKYPAVESALSIEEILIDGGYANAGGFQVQVSAFLFPEPPEQLQPIISSEGVEMKIQKINKVNDSYIIWAYESAGQR